LHCWVDLVARAVADGQNSVAPPVARTFTLVKEARL